MFGKDGKPNEDMLKNLLGQLTQEDSVLRVQMNDQRVMKLAEYDATKGYMKMEVSPEEVHSRFNELKTRVKTGSFTLKMLEDDVYHRWGITEESREAMGNEPNRDTHVITGFNIEDMKVAKLSNKSKKNT